MSTPSSTPSSTPTSTATSNLMSMQRRYTLLAQLRSRRHGHIGLLGGSFNPAHQGHAHIADIAMAHVQLDQIIWLVSPQNPLKSADGMAPFATRLASAQAVAKQCRHSAQMHVSAFEQVADLRFTADTVRFLATTCSHITFYWLMGADNLAQFHQWYRPQQILHLARPVVINRPGYQAAALASPIAQRMTRLPARRLRHKRRPARRQNRPYWSFIQAQLIALSATEIRTSIH
ncbi:MAG: nicotinate (nicotinamide) nucleotide adenylyltransferase [Alphaproteobacteria bacterium]|nr:nicotinate (nicotinamide) nucleotide adenylyltransferase [Alphaproteobacteria bacterium]